MSDRIQLQISVNYFSFIFFYQSMELIGGNEIQLPSLKRENISYVFPNKVSSSLMNVYLFFLIHTEGSKVDFTNNSM